MHSTIWDTIENLARRFGEHDDQRGLDPQEQWTLQVLKIAEETGEASQAVIGARGTNPRKGDSHTWRDVHAEVADVIITMRPGPASRVTCRRNHQAGSSPSLVITRLDARAAGSPPSCTWSSSRARSPCRS